MHLSQPFPPRALASRDAKSTCHHIAVGSVGHYPWVMCRSGEGCRRRACDKRAHIRHYYANSEVDSQRAELSQAWVVNKEEDGGGHNRETTYLGGRKKP
jgi:hypothetical protein